MGVPSRNPIKSSRSRSQRGSLPTPNASHPASWPSGSSHGTLPLPTPHPPVWAPLLKPQPTEPPRGAGGMREAEQPSYVLAMDTVVAMSSLGPQTMCSSHFFFSSFFSFPFPFLCFSFSSFAFFFFPFRSQIRIQALKSKQKLRVCLGGWQERWLKNSMLLLIPF